jgi:Xaa-Pro aminopeptidase
MKYQPLHPDFYKRNRQNVVGEMEQNSVAIITSHDEYPRSGDTTFPFRQNAELLYLCGIDQEETTLVLAPWHHDKESREILFIKNPSPEMVVWYGHRLTKEQAREISGIENVMFVEDMESKIHDIIIKSQNIYLHFPENPRSKLTHPTQEFRLIKKLRKTYPLHTYKRLAPILYPLRMVKHAEEFTSLRKACEITHNAFLRAAKAIKPGVYEYEIEAELIYEMTKSGATGHSFAPIVAAGADTCILHYIKNDKKMQNCDLLLMDFGAEYANYAADITRTVPVNGRFTPRQKQVYQAVLDIYKETIPLFKPGMTIHKINDYVFKRMDEELIKLGLYTEEDLKNQPKDKPLFKKYYMHNTSHFIGLDVHDVGQREIVFQPGMVLSCEPGIYIAEENIGVRLETDVVVGENPIDLFAGTPIEIGDIEGLFKV